MADVSTKKASETRQTNIRLPEHVIKQLQLSAEKEQRSMNKEAVKRLMDSLAKDGYAVN